MTRHNSHVRTEWLQIGTTGAIAATLCQAIERRLDNMGEGILSRDAQHSGITKGGLVDFVAPTAPSNWTDHHAGRYTVKVRGCDEFRAQAMRIGNDIWTGQSR